MRKLLLLDADVILNANLSNLTLVLSMGFFEKVELLELS